MSKRPRRTPLGELHAQLRIQTALWAELAHRAGVPTERINALLRVEDDPDAIEWTPAIPDGEWAELIQLARAQLLALLGRVDAAKAILRATPTRPEEGAER